MKLKRKKARSVCACYSALMVPFPFHLDVIFLWSSRVTTLRFTVELRLHAVSLSSRMVMQAASIAAWSVHSPVKAINRKKKGPVQLISAGQKAMSCFSNLKIFRNIIAHVLFSYSYRYMIRIILFLHHNLFNWGFAVTRGFQIDR